MSPWVLLVEDSRDDRELMAAAWEREGLDVPLAAAGDGVAALALLQRSLTEADGLPCVVLLDLKMPRMGGLQLLEELRARPEFLRQPVVMLTSSAEPSEVRRCYTLGANGYIVKPNQLRQLLAVVGLVGRYWTCVNEPPPAERDDVQLPAGAVR